MPTLRTAVVLGLAAAVAALAACGDGGGKESPPPPSAARAMRLSSPAFAPGGTIPTRYTCAGGGAPPPLRWSAPPRSTRELALFVYDPDAPGGTFVHWTLWRLAPGLRVLAGSPPRGAAQGENGAGDEGYAPPCPPKGDGPHRYVFRIYALRRPRGLASGANADAVRSALAGRALAVGRLVGRFERGG